MTVCLNELADGFDVLRICLLSGVAFVFLHNDSVPSENTIHRLWFRPDANDPGRNARLLHRRRNHTHFVDTIMFANKSATPAVIPMTRCNAVRHHSLHWSTRARES